MLEGGIQLTSQIGAGGMGTVYRARQESLNRDICVKFMHPHLVSGMEWLGRFKREAKSLSKLRSDHIVSVLFVGVYQGVVPYIAMELLNGRSMREIINSGDKHGWRWWAEIMLQLTRTMSMVHNQGIIHRDLKPDNVFICDSPEGPVAKILDFGLCTAPKLEEPETLTKSQDMIGSVHYMAPECFRGPHNSPAVDIYALGCIFYEVLTGAPPFDAETATALAVMHNSTEVPPVPSTIAPEVEANFLTDFIRRACHKVPASRFKDCAEMSDFLTSAARDGFYRPCNSSSIQVAKRFFPMRFLVSLTTVVAGIGVVGAVCGALQIHLFRKSIDELAHDAQAAILTKDYRSSSKCIDACLADPALSAERRINLLVAKAEAELALGNHCSAVTPLIQCVKLATPWLMPHSARNDVDALRYVRKNLVRALSLLSSKCRKPLAKSSLIASFPPPTNDRLQLAESIARIVEADPLLFEDAAIVLVELQASASNSAGIQVKLLLEGHRDACSSDISMRGAKSVASSSSGKRLEQSVDLYSTFRDARRAVMRPGGNATRIQLLADCLHILLVRFDEFQAYNLRILRKYASAYQSQSSARLAEFDTLAYSALLSELKAVDVKVSVKEGLAFALNSLQTGSHLSPRVESLQALTLAGCFYKLLNQDTQSDLMFKRALSVLRSTPQRPARIEQVIYECCSSIPQGQRPPVLIELVRTAREGLVQRKDFSVCGGLFVPLLEQELRWEKAYGKDLKKVEVTGRGAATILVQSDQHLWAAEAYAILADVLHPFPQAATYAQKAYSIVNDHAVEPSRLLAFARTLAHAKQDSFSVALLRRAISLEPPGKETPTYRASIDLLSPILCRTQDELKTAQFLLDEFLRRESGLCLEQLLMILPRLTDSEASAVNRALDEKVVELRSRIGKLASNVEMQRILQIVLKWAQYRGQFEIEIECCRKLCELDNFKDPAMLHELCWNLYREGNPALEQTAQKFCWSIETTKASKFQKTIWYYQAGEHSGWLRRPQDALCFYEKCLGAGAIEEARTLGPGLAHAVIRGNRNRDCQRKLEQIAQSFAKVPDAQLNEQDYECLALLELIYTKFGYEKLAKICADKFAGSQRNPLHGVALAERHNLFGCYPEALRLYRKSADKLNFAPGWGFSPYYGMVNCMLTLGLTDEALPVLYRQVNRKPTVGGLAEFERLLGESLYLSGRKSEAEQWWRKSADSNNTRLTLGVRLGLYTLANDETGAARVEKEYLELRKRAPCLAYELEFARIKCGRYLVGEQFSLAEERLERILSMCRGRNPIDREQEGKTLVDLAMAKLGTGDEQGADCHFREVLELQIYPPSRYEYYDLMLARIFIAIRDKNFHCANGYVKYLKEITRKTSPLLTRKLALFLPHCQQMAARNHQSQLQNNLRELLQQLSHNSPRPEAG